MQCARHLLLALACLAVPAAAACSSPGSSPTRGPRSVDEGPRILDEGPCLSCTPVLGGDTSDFGGGSGGCLRGESRALPPDEAQALLDEAQAMLDSFETSVGWVNPPNGDEPGGLEPILPPATLRATVERSGEPELATFVRSDNPNDVWTKHCRDHARIPIRLSVEISDGTLRAELPGHLLPGKDGAAWKLWASTDLSASMSTLDLEVDGRTPDRLIVIADWHYLEHFAGSLYFEGMNHRIVTVPNPPSSSFAAGCDVRDGGGTGDAGCSTRTLDYWECVSVGPVAHMPFGRCAGGGVPVDLDIPMHWLGGETVHAVYERAAIDIRNRALDATWCDGTAAGLRLYLGALTPGSACRDQIAGFSFATYGDVVSADGRLAKHLERGSLSLDAETHDLTSIVLHDAAGLFSASYAPSRDGRLAPQRSWSVFADDAQGTRTSDCLLWSDQELWSDHEVEGCACSGRFL